MSVQARALNLAYLEEMMKARPASALGRVRDLWWDSYVHSVESDGIPHALDRLNSYMGLGRNDLAALGAAYASELGYEPGSNEFRQRVNQFLKSNTGKMFERFCGLALAYALNASDAEYCINPFMRKTIARCPGLSRESFIVEVVLGDGVLLTPIDADLFAFNPVSPEDEVFLISVKSTLKDRFHNVPFWNLLRRCAVNDGFPDITARDLALLSRLKYIAVCSDLAEQQPDFGTDAGARNLLQIDAALLDGAYVTSSRARGLPLDCTNHLGVVRQHAFYRYSCFFEYLNAKR
jgi:hypothetical protein